MKHLSIIIALLTASPAMADYGFKDNGSSRTNVCVTEEAAIYYTNAMRSGDIAMLDELVSNESCIPVPADSRFEISEKKTFWSNIVLYSGGQLDYGLDYWIPNMKIAKGGKPSQAMSGNFGSNVSQEIRRQYEQETGD